MPRPKKHKTDKEKSGAERGWVGRHKKIKDYMKEHSEHAWGAVIVLYDMAKHLKMDVRTAQAHLDVMEMDRAGMYLGSGKRLFCTREGARKLEMEFKQLWG